MLLGHIKNFFEFLFTMSELEISFIQERKYQSNLLNILKKINESSSKNPPVLIELDCGMGKRVLSYLMVKKYFPHEKTLILLQASSSLQETADFFINKYKMDVGVLSSRTPSSYRKKLLIKNSIILATPQTLANTIDKLKYKEIQFKLILINEVDKIIRRTATRRTLVYPYPKILSYFNNSWIIGLSGTLRDSHIVVTDKVRVINELQTLAENLPNVRVITMEEIIVNDESYEKYIDYTLIKDFSIVDKEIEVIFQKLDSLANKYRKKIIDIAKEEGLIHENQKNLALIAGQLPVDAAIIGKYNSILMMRKYMTGMLPFKWKYFLKKFPEFNNEFIDSLSNKSLKISHIQKIIQKELAEESTKKVIIMVSYILTGETICKYLKKSNFDVFMISGRITDKNTVINNFRNSKSSNSALIMTSVGERDLDIPEAKLIIVYDSINTLKTMYQRFKRTRGGKVVCLSYSNTSEEKKVKRILTGIKEKYPWSIKVNV